MRLIVKATPRARKSGAAGLIEVGAGATALAVKLRSPPADGAANAELVKWVAKALGVATSRVTLVTGATSRLKQLRIEGDPAELDRRLEELAASY